jgi:uncharacterized protein
MFRNKSSSPQQVTSGRFEIERDGKIAFLQYTLSGGIIALSHTEVPKELRHHGIASELAHAALEYARENHLKVDVICQSVVAYLADHPEYSDLVLK